MVKSLKNIVIYSNTYPFGEGETFLHNEVLFLSQKFEKICIIPRFPQKTHSRALPSNVEIVIINSVPRKFSIGLFFEFLFILLGEKTRWKHLKHFRYSFSYYRNILGMQQKVMEFYRTIDKNAIHYCYWFEDWNILLSRMKRKGTIDLFFSRAHGYDLFEDRWVNKFIPLRNYQLKGVSKLIFACEHAKKYLLDEYPDYKQKYIVSKIGTYDNGEGPVSKSTVFTLVSCSNLVSIKRVHLICEILNGIEFPIKWIHFGDGILMNSLAQEVKKLPKNIEVELRGNTPNEEIIKFYSAVAVDCMILLSETEGGVPVSIQEAISFGIPVIGTDAGGISEIVNESTGMLLPLNFTISQGLDAIRLFHTNETGKNENFRKGVRAFWLQNHRAEVNFGNFYKILVGNAGEEKK